MPKGQWEKEEAGGRRTTETETASRRTGLDDESKQARHASEKKPALNKQKDSA